MQNLYNQDIRFLSVISVKAVFVGRRAGLVMRGQGRH